MISNRHKYKELECVSWSYCEDGAVAQGAHLVTIRNQEEQDWLVDTFGEDEQYWIGLTDEDEEGTWKWISGDPVTYTNWASGEPSNEGGCGDYGTMNFYKESEPGKWNDVCTSNLKYKAIIEKSP